MKLMEIIKIYLASPSFAGLAEGTKVNYKREINKIPKNTLNQNIKKIKRYDLFAYFEEHNVRGHHKVVVRRIFSFAHDHGYINHNPLFNLKIKKNISPIKAWSKGEIATALTSNNADFAFLIKFFLYTGQRRGDIIKIKWSDIFWNGDYIKIAQQKTKTTLKLPIHPSLKKALQANPKESTFVATRNSEAWTPHGVNYIMRKELKKLNLTGLSSHGLRKSCAIFLREAGASIAEIKAITGHQSDEMVNHYAAEADQFAMASKVIDNLPSF